MNFKDYMEELATVKQSTIEKIAKATLSHKSTVYRWANGETSPSKKKREIIANILDRDVQELFPEAKQPVNNN